MLLARSKPAAKGGGQPDRDGGEGARASLEPATHPVLFVWRSEMKMRWNPWFLTLALVLAASGTLLAQGVQFGTLVGTVTLTDGNPASGVAVTVTSSALHGERATVTQGHGDFILRGLR